MQVLQVADADVNALSGAELSSLSAAGSVALMALTPSSRRKQLLLLQHQQRSSMDTEALDEELEGEFDAQVQTPRDLVIQFFFLLCEILVIINNATRKLGSLKIKNFKSNHKLKKVWK